MKRVKNPSRKAKGNSKRVKRPLRNVRGASKRGRKSARSAKKSSKKVVRRISVKSIDRNQHKFGNLNDQVSQLETQIKGISDQITALGKVNNMAKQVEYATLMAVLISKQAELKRVSLKAKKVAVRVVKSCKRNAQITSRRTGLTLKW